MNLDFIKGFTKEALKMPSLKTPSFGKSIRGSAFATPSKTVKVDIPKFKLPKANAKAGYSHGGTRGISTNQY